MLLGDLADYISKGLMPHNQTIAFQTQKRKRELSPEAESIPDPLAQPSAKRRKSVGQPRQRTPSIFWNNLSRQWLTPRALREFDRRTVRPAVPLPPASSEVEKHHITQLKRFARHGGPSLANLRGVSPTAYTITSTYYDGTLKMYTVHPTQPADPEDRPNYHMTQLGAWALTGSREQFRQGAGAFRNARGLAKGWRDDVIMRANEQVNESQGVVPGSESPSLNLLPSFASEAPSQASATSVDKGPYTSDTVVHESETSTDELALDLRLPAKRLARSHQSHRKRRNPSRPSSNRRGHTPATMSSSRSTAASNATTESGERFP